MSDTLKYISDNVNMVHAALLRRGRRRIAVLERVLGIPHFKRFNQLGVTTAQP